MASFHKCGTCWMHQIIFCLLRMDEKGNFPAPLETMLGSASQVYPDALPLKRDEGCDGLTFTDTSPRMFEAPLEDAVQDAGFEDLLAQQRPRLFSCHIRAENLPADLSERGRLVLISRNPKDALVSGFFFLRKLQEKRFPDGKPVVKP